MKGKIQSLNISLDGKQILTLQIDDDFRSQYNELFERNIEVTIKPYKPKRSLNANAKSWLLTDKLAEKLLIAGVKVSKEEMHAEMIFRYGQVALDDNGEQICISTKHNVKLPEFYPYAKEIGVSELNGKVFTHYRIYRGSHTYDSKEMYIFLLGIIEECKEQGIETLSPEELKILKLKGDDCQ